MDAGEPPTQKSDSDAHQSLDLLSKMGQRLSQLRSWEQDHQQLVGQLQDKVEILALREAEIQRQSRDLDRRLAEVKAQQTQVETSRLRLADNQRQLDQQRQDLADQRLALDRQRKSLSTREADLAQRLQAAEQQKCQIERSRRELGQDNRLLEQRRQELEKEQGQIDHQRGELANAQQEVSDQRQQAVRQRIELSEQQERLEDQQRELAGQVEQRQFLLEVKQILKASEQKMIRRWATARTIELLSRSVLTVVLLAVSSVAATRYLPAAYTPAIFQDRRLELAGAVFGSLLIAMILVMIPVYAWLIRRPRVLGEQDESLLSSLEHEG